MERKEFGKEWQDEQREKMVRIQFPKTVKRIEDKAREEVFTEDERYHLVNLLEGGLRITDSISQSEIFKSILSKLKDNK